MKKLEVYKNRIQDGKRARHYSRSLSVNMVTRELASNKENVDPIYKRYNQNRQSSEDSLLELSFNSPDNITPNDLPHPSSLINRRKITTTKSRRKQSSVENYLQKLKQKQKEYSWIDSSHAQSITSNNISDLQTVPEVTPSSSLSSFTNESLYQDNSHNLKTTPTQPKQQRQKIGGTFMVKSAQVSRSKINLQKVFTNDNQCVSGYSYMARLQNNIIKDVPTMESDRKQGMHDLNGFLTTGVVTRQQGVANRQQEVVGTEQHNKKNILGNKANTKYSDQRYFQLKDRNSSVYQTNNDRSYNDECYWLNEESFQTDIPPNVCSIDLPPDLKHLSQMISAVEKNAIERKNQDFCGLLEE